MITLNSIRNTLDCSSVLEKLGIDCMLNEKMPCPFFDQPDENNSFIIDEDAKRWFCERPLSVNSTAGDCVDLYSLILYRKSFEELELDDKGRTLYILAEWCNLPMSRNCHISGRYKRLYLDNLSELDKMDSYSLHVLYQSCSTFGNCPLCRNKITTITQPALCDEFECTVCGIRGTVADYLSYELFEKPYNLLSAAQKKDVFEQFISYGYECLNALELTAHGDVFYYCIVEDKEGQQVLKSVTPNQAAIAQKFCEMNLLVFSERIRTFYLYDSHKGIWENVSEKKIEVMLTEFYDYILHTKMDGFFDVSLFISKRTHKVIREILNYVKAFSLADFCTDSDYLFIHTANGILIPTNTDAGFAMKNFSPVYRSYSRTDFPYILGAECPRFITELLMPAISEDDQVLLQKYAGQCLLGKNITQTFLVLCGTAGGGKGTILSMIEDLVGYVNCSQLRTRQLEQRFELVRMVGKTLLTGKDVAGDFLNMKSASVIKSLVGGDRLTGEAKGSNNAFDIVGNFNLIIAANSQLRINLDSDRDAWKRRMLIIDFNQPAVQRRIPDFSRKLLAEEGEGILAWAVEGARLLLNDIAETGKIRLSSEQEQRVDNLLAESDSLQTFVNERIVPGSPYSDATLSTEQIFSAYEEYCMNKGWEAKTRLEVGRQLPAIMRQKFRASRRNDIATAVGVQRGYRGFILLHPRLDDADIIPELASAMPNPPEVMDGDPAEDQESTPEQVSDATDGSRRISCNNN